MLRKPTPDANPFLLYYSAVRVDEIISIVFPLAPFMKVKHTHFIFLRLEFSRSPWSLHALWMGTFVAPMVCERLPAILALISQLRHETALHASRPRIKATVEITHMAAQNSL